MHSGSAYSAPLASMGSGHSGSWLHGSRCWAVDSTGGVAVEYPPDKTRHVVAAFGEKSNPIDVRVDLANCRLYVRSYGTPLFVKAVPTWLVEYDLQHREELQKSTVEPQVLPAECPKAPDAG